MSEESIIQCAVCGTLYNDIEEICPYCGEPQPSFEIHPDDELLFEQAVDPEAYEDFGEAELSAYPSTDEEELYLEEEYGEEYLETPYLETVDPEEEHLLDDIFAVAGEETEAYDEFYDEADEEDDFEEDEATEPRPFRKRRLLLGCLGLFICVGALYGSIGALATYHGLQERAQDIQTEAETHYQRGQENLANGAIELAIAEFERALSLNPNLLPAREALREAQNIAQSQPTPTSETRSAAAAEIFERAEDEADQENWVGAVEILSQVRDLDPDYQPERVSGLLYEANYQLGLQSIKPDKIIEALNYFEQALNELPGDASATAEKSKAALYIDGKATLEQGDANTGIDVLSQLYQQDASYLDVAQLLAGAYERFGDELTAKEAWCQAERRYRQARALKPNDASLQTKIAKSRERCQGEPAAQVTGTKAPTREPASSSSATSVTQENNISSPNPVTATTVATAATSSAASSGGSIFYAMYNFNEAEWQVLSTPVNGGQPKVIVTNGTMPAVSPNGRLLLYRSEAIEAEGFHVFDLTSGEDKRITILRQHILPRWGGDNSQFIFSVQEPATGRWQIQRGFADGKSEPQILGDGRTPDPSLDNQLIAYQGTDVEGNNPGIYLTPVGGEPFRLTKHESDRAPDFSPNGKQLAYMSTQNGNWDIYTTSIDGGAPRRLTTGASNEGLPAWSPDGAKIAFVSDRGGNWNIYVVNAAGGEPVKVTAWDGNQRADWLMSQIWWAR